MSLVMELDPQTEARLQEKAQQTGADPGQLAALIVADALRADSEDYADQISPDEMAAILSAVRLGDADFAAGRYRTLAEVITDKQRRLGIGIER